MGLTNVKKQTIHRLTSSNSSIAEDIIEHTQAIAIRLNRSEKIWKTQFITKNIENYGYSWHDFVEEKIYWNDIIHPSDYGDLCYSLDNYERLGIDRFSIQYRIIAANGEAVWMTDFTTVSRNEDNEIVYFDCIVSDYTQIKNSLDKVEDNYKQQAVLNDILQSLHQSDRDESLQIILDRTGKYLDISRVILFEDNYNHSKTHAVYEWCNNGIESLLTNGEFIVDYQNDIPDIEADLRIFGMKKVDYGQVSPESSLEFDKEGVIAAAIFSVYLQDNRYGFICFDECVKERYWADDTLAFLKNISNLVSTALLHKMNQEFIRSLAYYDHLTNLPNRYSFDDHLQEAIFDAKNNNLSGYVLFIDMDDFKIVNDAYGHDYGDALLLEFAHFLREQFARENRVFRFGGDEFVVLVDHSDAENINDIIFKTLARARLPWETLDKKFYCTISIGIVRFPYENCSVKDVIRNADIAMYKAKKMGKNNYVFYNNKIDNDSIGRAELESMLRDAINNNMEGFEVYYQPIVNLEHGIPTGAEALIRWFDSQNRMIMPGEFISLAEYLGLIIPIGEFVLRKAAEKCKVINDSGYPNFCMSINVSIRQFQQPDIAKRFGRILRETGVIFSNIILEITEGLAVNNLQRILCVFEELQNMGIQIAMDDFGAGYSSLTHMRAMPIDIIKIDRSFIRDITLDAYSESFIRLITNLGHSMNKQVCIEGVETIDQLAYCKNTCADTVQGFLFSRPVPSDELEETLANLAAIYPCIESAS